jgi:hypothetical protein
MDVPVSRLATALAARRHSAGCCSVQAGCWLGVGVGRADAERYHVGLALPVSILAIVSEATSNETNTGVIPGGNANATQPVTADPAVISVSTLNCSGFSTTYEGSMGDEVYEPLSGELCERNAFVMEKFVEPDTARMVNSNPYIT